MAFAAASLTSVKVPLVLLPDVVLYQVVVSINEMDVSLEQPLKANSPIEVIESGIVTEERDVQEEKASLAIVVTESGIVYAVDCFLLGYRIKVVSYLLNRTPSILE